MNKMLPGRATSLAQNVMKWIPVQNLPLRLVIMKRQKRWNLNICKLFFTSMVKVECYGEQTLVSHRRSDAVLG